MDLVERRDLGTNRRRTIAAKSPSTVVTLLILVGLLPVALVSDASSGLLSLESLPVVETVRSVTPLAETEPVPSTDDAADDPAIWIHPTDPSQSTVIGTDKKGGLAVYDLSGRQLQYLPHGRLNNVDIRPNFPLAGESVALVTASDRDEGIAVYQVDTRTRLLEDVVARPLRTELSVYGLCMYRSPVSGNFYTFVNSEEGEVEQWKLYETEEGKVEGRVVRTFDVGARTEGCVADDELGDLYIGIEDDGIWKFGAEPDAGTVGQQVDSTGTDGYLTAEVEGLALYDASNGTGYLIASSQGSDSFVIYRREGNNEYVMTFRIRANGSIDGVTHTDGIDVTSAQLGAAYPGGLFVAQDHLNGDENQNFKLVSWLQIASAMKRVQLSSLEDTSH